MTFDLRSQTFINCPFIYNFNTQIYSVYISHFYKFLKTCLETFTVLQSICLGPLILFGHFLDFILVLFCHSLLHSPFDPHTYSLIRYGLHRLCYLLRLFINYLSRYTFVIAKVAIVKVSSPSLSSLQS